jgi:hypothetical protein
MVHVSAILDAVLGPLGGLLAGIVAVLGAWLVGKRQGAQSARVAAEMEGLRDATERQDRGRQAVQDGRDSGLSPDDRLRRNDGDW